MIQITAQSRILLARQPADFRRGIDGFLALCREQLNQDPRQPALFVFLNRPRTMLRVITYDGTGFWLMTKRLSQGRFAPLKPGQGAVETVTARALSQYLRGLQEIPDFEFKKAS